MWMMLTALGAAGVDWLPTDEALKLACASTDLFIGDIVRVTSYDVTETSAGGLPIQTVRSDLELAVVRDVNGTVGDRVTVTVDGGRTEKQTLATPKHLVQPKVGLRYVISTSPLGIAVGDWPKGKPVLTAWRALDGAVELPEASELLEQRNAACDPPAETPEP